MTPPAKGPAAQDSKAGGAPATRPTQGGRARESHACSQPGPAGAWSAPVHLGTSEGFYHTDPQVVLNDQDQGLAVWEERHQGRRQVFGASWRGQPGQAKGLWQKPVCLSGPDEGWDAQVALNDSGAGMAVWTSRHGVWSASFDGREWGAPVRLDDAGGAPKVRIDAAGRALAVWAGDRTFFRHFLVARFEPEAGWGAPKMLHDLLEAREVTSPHLAMTPDGQAAVCYLEPKPQSTLPCSLRGRSSAAPVPPPHRVWVRFFDPAEGWGEPLVAADGGDGNHDFSNPSLALGPEGRAVLMFSDAIRVPSMEPDGQPRRVTVLKALDRTSRNATLLHEGPPCLPDVAMDGSGRAFLAWVTGSPHVLRTTGGAPEPAVQLGAPGGLAMVRGNFSLSVAPDGTAVALYCQPLAASPLRRHAWSQHYLPEEAAKAQGLSSGWQPPVRVSSGEDGPICAPKVAMNNRGVALALWDRGTQEAGQHQSRIEAVAWRLPEPKDRPSPMPE